jgi:hypothetical protein
MEAFIKVSTKEFNQELFLKLQALFSKLNDGYITISVKSEIDTNTVSESPEQYEMRLLNSLAELEAGKGVTFTMESFEDFIHKDQ